MSDRATPKVRVGARHLASGGGIDNDDPIAIIGPSWVEFDGHRYNVVHDVRFQLASEGFGELTLTLTVAGFEVVPA